MAALTLAGSVCVVASARAVDSPEQAVVAEDSADTGHDNLLGIGLGVANLQVNDALVRGLRYDGAGGEVALEYRRIGAESSHDVGLRFPMAALRNRYGHRALGWDAQLGYGYLHAVEGDGRTAVYVGARLRWDWAVQYYEDFDEEHLYWATSYELAPLIAAGRTVGDRHAFRVEFDTPLLSLVSRPPARRYYKIDRLTHANFFFRKTHESTRVTSVHEHIALRFRLAHALRLSDSVRLQTRYAFDFMWEAEPQRILLITQSLSFGVDYAF